MNTDKNGRITSSNLGYEYKWFNRVCERLGQIGSFEASLDDREDLGRAVRVIDILLKAANDNSWARSGLSYLHKAHLLMEGEA